MGKRNLGFEVVDKLSKLIAFGMNHIFAIAMLAAAAAICSIFATILETLLSPRNAFVIAIIFTIALCSGVTLYWLYLNVSKTDGGLFGLKESGSKYNEEQLGD